MKKSKSKSTKKWIGALSAVGALMVGARDARAIELSSLPTDQRVTITWPTQGSSFGHSGGNCDLGAKLPQVSGTLLGFTKSSFDSGEYVLLINGERLPPSRIFSTVNVNVLNFSEVVRAPYFPLQADRAVGDPSGGYPVPSRYPWSADLGLGWDKRVRSILVEVVPASKIRNPDAYVVRDTLSYIDPRTPNCGNYSYQWKGFDQTVENGFSLQFTPKHLKALEPIVHQNMLPPGLPLSSGTLLTNEPAGICKPFATLPVSAQAELTTQLIAYRVSRPTAVTVLVCFDNPRTTLTSIEAKGPSNLTVDPTRNPMTASLDYTKITVDGRMSFQYRLRGITSTGVLLPSSADSNYTCPVTTEVQLSFDREGLVFGSSGDRVISYGASPMIADSVSSSSLEFDGPLCGARSLDDHRTAAKTALTRSTRSYYEDSFNMGFDIDSRNSLSYAMDQAIYPLSTGRLLPDGSELGSYIYAAPTSVSYSAGNPTSCEEGEKGLFVMQSFQNSPASRSLWNQWGSWENDDLERLFDTRKRRVQSTCPIIGRDSEARAIFDTSRPYESPLLMTTGPINQVLAARMGSHLKWSLNTLSDSDANQMALSLGLTPSSSLFIEIESTLPPFLSPEWYFQVGHLNLRAVEKSGSTETEIFRGVSTFFLDSVVTADLGLGIGNTSALEDLMGISEPIDPTRYSSTFHSISNGGVRPTSAQLRATFEPWLQSRLSQYLIDSLRGVGSVEFASTPPSESSFFDVFQEALTTSRASALIPYRFR